MRGSYVAACRQADDSRRAGTTSRTATPTAIKVWIQEDLPDRVAATQEIVDAFTEESGVKVELVPVAEDQFNQLLTSAAAAGDLPDVIGGISLPAGAHPLRQRAARHRRRRRRDGRPSTSRRSPSGPSS